jgi:hypothetical protein
MGLLAVWLQPLAPPTAKAETTRSLVNEAHKTFFLSRQPVLKDGPTPLRGKARKRASKFVRLPVTLQDSQSFSYIGFFLLSFGFVSDFRFRYSDLPMRLTQISF